MSTLSKYLINNKIQIILILFSFIFVFFNSKCSPLYLFNDWTDPNIYFSMGKGAINGKVLYKDIFDHKGPLIFFIYSLGYLISNDTFLGIYIIESILLSISLIFAYKTAKILLNEEYAFIVAIAFTLLLFVNSNYGGSADEFITPLIVISLYYFTIYARNIRLESQQINKQMFMYGMMFALAFFSKLSICVFWIPIIATILLNLILEKRYEVIKKSLTFFLISIIIVSLPFIAYFLINNAIEDFIYSYITFNSLYAGIEHYDINIFSDIMIFAIKSVLTRKTFMFMFVGVLVMLFYRKYLTSLLCRIALLCSFILLFIVIMISPLGFYLDYTRMPIYAYSIFILIAISDIISRVTKKLKIRMNIYIQLSFILIILIAGVYMKGLFGEEIDCLLRKKKCSYMQKEFAEIIKKEENPTILDLSLDSGVSTKANTIASFKYFFYPNIEYKKYPLIRDYQSQLIKKKEPLFIIATNTDYYMVKEYYKMLDETHTLSRNYEIVATYPPNNILYKRRKSD